MWRADTDKRDLKSNCWKTLYSHFLQIYTVRNQSIYRCMSWMQFLFFGNCEKKILWKYLHALYIYQHNFHYQNVQHSVVCHGKVVSFRKIESAQHLKGIYIWFFKKTFYLLFLVNCLKCVASFFFFSFNVSHLEIKICAKFWQQFHLIYIVLYWIFFCPDCLEW